MTIAKELDSDKCEYAAVLNHEMKRHDSNTSVVDALADKLRADLPVAVKALESSLVPARRKLAANRNMQAGVKDLVAKYRQQMLDLMEEYNGIIDTPEALEKMATSCKYKRLEEQKSKGEPTVKAKNGAEDYFSKFRGGK